LLNEDGKENIKINEQNKFNKEFLSLYLAQYYQMVVVQYDEQDPEWITDILENIINSIKISIYFKIR
jgi:hypothetical protein